MKRVRAAVCVSLLLLVAVSAAAELSLPDLFKRAKERFAAADYKGSLADFEMLDAVSARTGFENDRAKLLPVITFYRGANLAALGKKDEAKEAFVAYLTFVPRAAIASPGFPKATVDLFEQARNEANNRSATMTVMYAAFAVPGGFTLAPDTHWIETPTRYLLTPAQRKEYVLLTTDAERAIFIDAFWRQLDPSPATDANELRGEFERRMAFADANFTTPKMGGRFTEQAAIFAFLGAPNYVGLSQATEDAIGRLRASGNDPMQRSTTIQTFNPSLERGRTPIKNEINSAVWANDRKKEDNLETDSMRAKRESWYYRHDRLPKNVKFAEVHFDFVTKEGYGTRILQKESEPMLTLSQAVEIARAERRLP
jgi:GWxTD domain-containing protein